MFPATQREFGMFFGRAFRIVRAAALRIGASFLAAALLSSSLVAEEMPPLAGIAHMAFRVSDLTKSLEFYQKLGFEKAFEFSDQGKTTVAFVKINDSQFMELYPRKDDSQSLGFMHFCFEADDIAVVHDAYVKQGLSPEDVKKARAGNLLFVMHDPEGQLLEYTQYLPGSLHSLDRGKHLGAQRVAGQLVRGTTLVRDVAAERLFYTGKLGFDGKKPGGELRIPGDSGDGIELEATTPSAKPRMTFGVASTKKAAKELRRLGFQVQTKGGTVSLSDPDGVVIVFEQLGKEKKR